MGCGASIGRLEEFSSFYAQYSLGSTPKALGKGSYGSVFLANAKNSQSSTFAVKVQTSRRTATKKIEHEAKIWKLCASHRNVVHFFQMCQEADIYFMVMEACQMSLFDRLIDNPRWNWKDLAGDLHQLVSGLQHLHSRRVLHSDIKAENALYGGPDGKILKLADFGLAVYITPSEGPLTRARGSRSYMAPEMLAGEGYAFPADMWSFGVLVYVILVGQFPIGQSKQTKSELTRNIIKVEKEPARVTNLANKLKRAIATEQSKLDRKLPTSSESHRSSSEFQRVMPSASEGGEAPEEMITRHVNVQMARLKVVAFIRLFLQRAPEERSSAHEASQSELFRELAQMRQEHRALEFESTLLIINRRPLKRTDTREAQEEAKPEEVKEAPKPEEPRSPEKPSSKPTEEPTPPTSVPPSVGETPKPALRRKSFTSGRLGEETSKEGEKGADPLRRRSLTASNLAENSGMQLLQVPKGRRKSQQDLPSSPSGVQSGASQIMEAHERDLKPSTEAEPSSAAGAATQQRQSSLPDESEFGHAGNMTKSFSRMSTLNGARSMLSRDNSGFDLLHQLAHTNVRGDSSWHLEQSGIAGSTLRHSNRSKGFGSNSSLPSGISMRSNHRHETDELPSPREKNRSSAVSASEHGRSSLDPTPGRSSISVVEEEGPQMSKLQRRVSLGAMGGESPQKNLRRRVSFDEVLVMQHMVPLVPPNAVMERASEGSGDPG